MGNNTELEQVLDDLRKPFHPSQVTWKPGSVKGERALAMPYADLRAYMDRLDTVCGTNWSVAYEPWGEARIICKLTIMGVTRSSTGETTNESERSEIGGTVAEAQAFKRASAMFGLGRYLYQLPTGWADYDPTTKRFTEKARARLTGILVQHYRRATGGDTTRVEDLFDVGEGEASNSAPVAGKQSAAAAAFDTLYAEFDALGLTLYGDKWQTVCMRNASRISKGKTENSRELKAEEIQQLIVGMNKVQANRVPAAQLNGHKAHSNGMAAN